MTKKIIMFCIVSFCLCFSNVYAVESIKIENITLNSKSDYTEIIRDAEVDGLSVSFDVKFREVGDFAKYDIIINNSSDKDYEISADYGKNDYITYKYDFENNNNIVKKNSKKHLSITILYKTQVPPELVNDNNYEIKEKLFVYLNNENKIINPETLSNYLFIILILLLFVLALIIYKKGLKRKMVIGLILLTMLLPLTIYAAEKLQISINNKIHIKVSKPLSEMLINEHSDDFIKYNGLVTDEVGKTVQSTNVYFAKSQDNNNIIVGDYCWQIFRTTEQGGLKIIYNGVAVDGTCPSGREAAERIIGKSKYNDLPDSIASVGYMYNKRYVFSSGRIDSNSYFGKDVKYSNGVYTLIDPKIGEDENHHYSCNSNDINATCEAVKYHYYVYSDYNMELTDGKKIKDVLDEMLYADDVNKNDSVMKSYIDDWFENNFNKYSYLLDKNVYCNDRSLANYDVSGWNPNGGSINTYLLFRNNVSGADLSCPNLTDQFSTKNDKAKLKYSIALITEPERNAGGGDLFKIEKWYWGMSPVFYRYDSLAFVSYVLYNGDYASSYFYNSDNVNSSNDGMINVRPVISLHKYVEINGGNGSAQTPYIIKYE